MQVSRDQILPARVLNEDSDFITLEVAKHDDVKFTLQRDEHNQVVGGDQFHTILFITFEDGQGRIWKPWEE